MRALCVPQQVILKVVTTNICGSDQHMVRGRTTAKPGFVLGHEITGEVIETGSDVEFIKKGDLCSVPFNIACGRCALCKAGHTGVCLNVNPARPGAAYGYVDMGGWIGGQSEYVMIPYADFNLLKFPDYDQAMEKIKSLTTLSDIFPTGFHGAIQAGVHAGATVYVAGAGPVGLASALGCHLLGAACVIVGDYNQERLAQARSFGCETVDVSSDVSLEDQLINILGVPEVDCGIDCVGFEARGCGCAGHQAEVPAQVLNDMMAVTKAAGSIGIPGLYVTGDPGAVDDAAKEGNISTRFGLGWVRRPTPKKLGTVSVGQNRESPVRRNGCCVCCVVRCLRARARAERGSVAAAAAPDLAVACVPRVFFLPSAPTTTTTTTTTRHYAPRRPNRSRCTRASARSSATTASS